MQHVRKWCSEVESVVWASAVTWNVRNGRPKPMKNGCERTTSEGTGFGKRTNHNSRFIQLIEVIHRSCIQYCSWRTGMQEPVLWTRFVPRLNFVTLVEMGGIMSSGLCQKIMAPLGSKWNTLEVILSSYLIVDTRNLRYLKSFIHLPSCACNCCIFSNVISFFGHSKVLVEYLLKNFVTTHGFRGRRIVLVLKYRAGLTGSDMNKRVILTLTQRNLSVRCVM